MLSAMLEYYLRNNDLMALLLTAVGFATISTVLYYREKRKVEELKREITALRSEPKP